MLLKLEIKASSGTFSFSLVEEKTLKKLLGKLSEKKTCQISDISLWIIKENIDIFTKFLTSAFNEAITFSQYLSSKKLADIIPVIKRDDRNLKISYRSINIFSSLSKMKMLYMIKSLFLSSISSQCTSAALEKALIDKTLPYSNNWKMEEKLW